jgi:hypothetical protein
MSKIVSNYYFIPNLVPIFLSVHTSSVQVSSHIHVLIPQKFVINANSISDNYDGYCPLKRIIYGNSGAKRQKLSSHGRTETLCKQI